MNYLLLFVLVPACLGFDFDCLKGPDFWCANFANAQKCNKITECFLENKSQKKAVDVSENSENQLFCDLCIQVVTTVDDKFRSFTQQEFIASVDSIVCEQLQGETRNACKFLVTTYGPLVYNEIKNFSTPDKVCSFIKACKSSGVGWSPKILGNYKLGSNETCAKCKEVFAVVESMFSKITPGEFQFLLENVICNEVPSELRPTCKMLVDGYSSQLYELIKSVLDGNRMCTLFHLCSTQSTLMSASWNCETCVDVVTVLKKDLINVSESDLANFVKSATCSKLSYFEWKICVNYVNKLAPVFYNDIHSALTPQQICTKEKLCSIQNQKSAKMPTKSTTIKCEVCEFTVGKLEKFLSDTNNINRAKLFVKSKICVLLKSWNTECSNVVDNYGEMIIKLIIDHMNSDAFCQMIGACNLINDVHLSGVQKVAGVECDACKLVAKQLKKFISDPNRQAEIKIFIKNKICPIFLSDKSKCQQLVDEFYSLVLNFVISELDVDKICSVTGFCSTVKSGGECAVCELVMSQVLSVVTSNHTEQVVTNFVTSEICPRLESLANQCATVTKTYLPFLFTIARSTLNSKLLCEELHLCTLLSNKRMQMVMKNKLSNSTTCDVCLFIVNELHDILTNVNYQTAIENFIKTHICSHFGADAQKCVNDINQYYSLVVNIIVEFLKPSLCSEFRLCNSTNVMDFRQPIMNLIASKEIPHDIVCSKFYNYLQLIQRDMTKTNIVLGLISLCDEMYSHDKSKCTKQFRNIDNIIRLFSKSKNVHEFCKMTKMFPKNPKISLGVEKCSWGPGFWCVSRQHAIACGPGAVKHCEMSVWSEIPIL